MSWDDEWRERHKSAVEGYRARERERALQSEPEWLTDFDRWVDKHFLLIVLVVVGLMLNRCA